MSIECVRPCVLCHRVLTDSPHVVYCGLSAAARTKEDEAIPKKWHDAVRVFAAHDAKSNELLGHFYLDLFSRPGKFGHQCVVPLAPSFLRADGTRVTPICAILGNMTKATAERPSLLRHAEVSTLFHELGHVFHAVLTKVDYSIFSWTWPMMPWRGGVEQGVC
jgi:thimet oligopeptidase